MICSIQKLLTWLMFQVFHLAWSTLLLWILERGLLWATNFGFAACSSNSQLVTRNICSHFATSSGFVYLVKPSQGLPHEAFHVTTKSTLNPDNNNNNNNNNYRFNRHPREDQIESLNKYIMTLKFWKSYYYCYHYFYYYSGMCEDL